MLFVRCFYSVLPGVLFCFLTLVPFAEAQVIATNAPLNVKNSGTSTATFTPPFPTLIFKAKGQDFEFIGGGNWTFASLVYSSPVSDVASLSYTSSRPTLAGSSVPTVTDRFHPDAFGYVYGLTGSSYVQFPVAKWIDNKSVTNFRLYGAELITPIPEPTAALLLLLAATAGIFALRRRRRDSAQLRHR